MRGAFCLGGKGRINLDVTMIFVAFIAGVLSFLSPCVFPLVPAYVSNLTGSLIEGDRIHVHKRLLFMRSISFILGFSVVFVVMGASATFIGQFFSNNFLLIGKIAGLFIIIFGLQMAGILSLRFLMMDKQWMDSDRHKRTGNFGSFMLGLAFGSGWTPCVGLALSSILMLASSSETVYSGMFLLFIYALGLGIPFLLISLLLTYSLGIMKKLNRFMPLLSKINGWILVGLGFLLFTGQLQKISGWLARFSTFNI